MKKLVLAAVAATGLLAMGTTAADAYPHHGWHHRHHRVCTRFVWRHHHHERVCVRWGWR
ncbi:MAG: hypothetical protein JSR60_08440 [Proteobacteria bacterium]|nr:hypothetical protein [Pseudomonadota bacterium]